MYISVLLPSILALFALYKQKLTLGAILLAWTLGIIICYFGGYYAFAALVFTFLLTILSDKIKKKEDRDEKRNIYQIISNVLTPAMCILLFYITSNDIFYIMYFCTIGSSLADTLASAIGPMSKRNPINILTLKKMKHGESGAISLLGLTASLIGGTIIGLTYYIHAYIISNYLLIILMSLFGSFIDSLYGVAFQAKYKCSVCNKNVEVTNHCNKETILIKGYKFMDNNAVNLLNNLSVLILSYILLL